MPPAVAAFAVWALAHPVLAMIVRTILINVVLGANTIQVDGEVLHAIGFRPRTQL